MNKYLLYQPSGRPFLAFPQGSTLRAMSLFPATTWRKKAVRFYLQLADLFRVPLPGVVQHENVPVFSTSLSAISHFIKIQGGYPNQPLLIMWNREYKRNRAYLWLENEQDCQDMAFAKIARKNNNEMDFRREYEVLTTLSNLEITFKVPRPLFFSNNNQISILLTSSLPALKTPFSFLSWFDIDAHITPVTMTSRKKITYSQLEMLEWFKLFQTSIDKKSFQTIKKCLQKKFFDVGFIHGDMGSENTFIIDGCLWVIDWEKSSPEGPIATDRVAHWLGSNVQEKGLNKKLIHSFLECFINGSDYKPDDILLAICYLTLMAFSPADFIFQYFKQDNFSIWI